MGAVLGVPRVSVLARVVAIESAVPVTFYVRVFLVGIFPGQDRGGQHLVDALAVHVHDLELPFVPGEDVAGLRHAAQQQHHHARECLVACLVLFGHGGQVQPVLQFGDGNQPVQQPRTVGPLQCPAVIVVG